MESHFLSIAEVARRTGLSAHTLRYYERIGLLTAVPRAQGGQRRYAASDLEWIGFLVRLRATNMPIQGMLDFARLRREGPATIRDRRELLERHLSDVIAHMRLLAQSAEVLQDKIAHYRRTETGPSSQASNPHREGAHDDEHDPQRHDDDQAPGPLRKRPGQATGDRR